MVHTSGPREAIATNCREAACRIAIRSLPRSIALFLLDGLLPSFLIGSDGNGHASTVRALSEDAAMFARGRLSPHAVSPDTPDPREPASRPAVLTGGIHFEHGDVGDRFRVRVRVPLPRACATRTPAVPARPAPLPLRTHRVGSMTHDLADIEQVWARELEGKAIRRLDE